MHPGSFESGCKFIQKLTDKKAIVLALSLTRRGDRNMTVGSISHNLIAFTVPILAGNVFQQLYNTIDSIIVGNYVGREALAAIGCITPIMNMFINSFMGFATGAGVVLSKYYGADDEEDLHRAVQTVITFVLILCVLFTAVGLFFTSGMLKMMKTPEAVFQDAAQYLHIIFSGISAMLLYNIGAGILRAVGDSKRPLYFLILCTVLNTVLDIWFVKYLHWGIRGAALATVISMSLSAILVLLLLSFTNAPYRIVLLKPMISGKILGSVCRISLPTAFQMGLTSFSNIFVQSYVNIYGSAVMAGWTIFVKIDGFAAQPIISLSAAITTFVGQNLGAQKLDRVRKTPRYGFLIAAGIFLLILVPLILFAHYFAMLFTGEREVIEYGVMFIRRISPFYLFYAINQIYAGMLRGTGHAVSSMNILLLSFVGCRQLYLYISHAMGLGLTAVAYGYPSGWIVCSILMLSFYYSRDRLADAASA